MKRRLPGLALVTALSFSQPAVAAPPGPLAGVRVLQITLPSRDLDRSVRFYRDVLGAPLQFQIKDAAFFDLAGVRLRIALSKQAPSTGAEVYFDDPQLSKAEQLRSRGVVFAVPPETAQRGPAADLKLLEFLDPDGNALALMGEVSR